VSGEGGSGSEHEGEGPGRRPRPDCDSHRQRTTRAGGAHAGEGGSVRRLVVHPA
jgi:hypothetical protein